MKKAIFLFASLLLSACFSPIKMYSGNDLPVTEVGHYYMTNAPGFTSQFYINTNVLDGRDFRKDPPAYYQAYLAPGKHTVELTFIDYDNFIIPINMKEKLFQGFYRIEFEVKPGKKYAPIFNMNLPGQQMVSEMCIAEIGLNQSLSKTRDPMPYVACGKPNLQPTEENLKICREWSWIGTPPETYADACTQILPGGFIIKPKEQ